MRLEKASKIDGIFLEAVYLVFDSIRSVISSSLKKSCHNVIVVTYYPVYYYYPGLPNQ